MLARAILVTSVTSGPTAEQIEALAADLARFESNQSTLASLASGGYEPAVDALLAVPAVRDLPELAGGVLNGDAAPMAELLNIDPGASAAFAAFEDVVSARVADRQDELVDAAQARVRRYEWVAGAALAGVLVGLVLLTLGLLAWSRGRNARLPAH